MTPVFCCGFECGATAAHWNVTATAAFDTTIKRSGARSMKFTGTSSACTLVPALSGSVGVARFYLYFVTLPTFDTQIFRFASTSSIRGELVFRIADGQLYARQSATFVSPGFTPALNTWYCVDVKADVTNNPWTIDIKIDGTALGQGTSAVAGSTLNTANFSANAGNGEFYIDDVIISQTSGDYPIGPGYVNHFVPTSDGTHSGLTAGEFQRTLTGTDIVNATTTAFQLVDDAPLESGASVDWINMVAPSAAADYVECIFGPPSGINTPLVAPRAVEVVAGIHQAGTGTGNMEIRMNDNGTTNAMYTATTVAGVTSVAYKRKHYANNIANGGVWTVASGAGNFNNLRVRFGSPAAVDANPDQYLDCIMLEAEFKEILFNKILNINQTTNRATNW